MRVDVVSIFPDLFAGPMSTSMLGLARDRGLLRVVAHDLRDWTEGVHRQVDDCAYGGGPGMVMKPEPFFKAVRDVRRLDPAPGKVVLMSPQGRLLDQRLVEELAGEERLIILCGRYEGFDERIRSLADLQVSIGDYVLTGGELPAMVLVDAISRLIPGVLGHEDSAEEESFSWGLLEYPQYTRPAEWEGMRVPDVLVSGDHARIRRWRREQAIVRTARLRPGLLDRAALGPEERALAERALAEADEEPEPEATDARDAGTAVPRLVLWLVEMVVLVGLSFVLATAVRTWLVQPYIIPSGSMESTLRVGDQVLVNKRAYLEGDPRPGDIVVFRDPARRLPALIKRVVAVEGQTVDIRDGEVYVDGGPVREPYVGWSHRDDYSLARPVRVPRGHVWLMGDNRAESGDSREFGPQPESAIAGKAVAIYWPMAHLSRL